LQRLPGSPADEEQPGHRPGAYGFPLRERCARKAANRRQEAGLGLNRLVLITSDETVY
jgi:hypothetical protein